MNVDRKKCFCAVCHVRVGVRPRKTSDGPQWRCPEHLEGTEPIKLQRPGKEKAS